MPGPQSATAEWGSALRSGIGFVLLVVAHFAVGPLVTGPVGVDFAMIALLFACVRLRAGLAALLGFLLGLTLDALVPEHFGAATLVLTVLGYGASRLKAAFFTDNIALTALFIFLGSWLFDLAMALLTGLRDGSSAPMALLVWAPLSSAVTALVALLLLTLVHPLYRSSAR